MRTHGTLARWNDDRGFGFITPAKGPPDVFVHISAFPRDGVRPRLNELISFEVETGSDGKTRAVRVMRPGQKARKPAAARVQHEGQARRAGGIISFLVIAAIGTIAYTQYTRRAAPVAAPVETPVETQAETQVETPPETPPETPAETAAADSIEEPSLPASRMACDGRTMCSQMRSCAEATFFIRNCPNTAMDGDGDGVPCESQWCN